MRDSNEILCYSIFLTVRPGLKGTLQVALGFSLPVTKLTVSKVL